METGNHKPLLKKFYYLQETSIIFTSRARRSAEMTRDPKKNNSCPRCRLTGAHYQKETDTWICDHCDYSWHFIEHCINRQDTES
jgi:hypothetical protein